MVEQDKAAAKHTIAAFIAPIARLMIDNGVTLQEGVEMLKSALVESALARQPSASASHLSLITGVHRKDIKRLEKDEPTPQKSTAAARVLAIWQNDAQFAEAGEPCPLSRTGENGFDALVGKAKVDAASATVLSILLASGNVEEKDGLLHFVSASMVPEDRTEKLHAAVSTLKPHLDTTVSNLLGEEPQFDQALRYSHLTESAAKELERNAETLALAMLNELGRQAHQLQQKEEGGTLFVAGAYTHKTEHDQ